MSAPKRGRRKAGASLVRCAPVRLLRAMVGENQIPEKLLHARVDYLIDLVLELARSELAKHWNESDLKAYLTDPRPAFAYKAWGQSFGWPGLKSKESDVPYLPSRAAYCALEAAGRTVRSAKFRMDILEALLADLPVPAKADAVSVRNLTRALNNYAKKNNGQRAKSFWDLEPDPPKVARQVLLAATDSQFCVLAANEINLLLPLIANPQSPKDWSWHLIPYRRPKHLEGLACKPTLRLDGHKIIADMPFEREGANLISAITRRVMGFDWGINTPLTGTASWLSLEQISAGGLLLPCVSGRAVRFQADGLLWRTLNGLCRKIERLSLEIDEFSRFLGVPVETEPKDVRSKNPIAKNRALAWRERVRTAKKYNDLLDEFAHLASRWAIEQTLAAHCDTIVLEDLKSLEPRIGKRNNLRMILSLRGQIAKYIYEKAEPEGLRVITVNARGTSSFCSRCGKETKHYTCADAGTRKAGYVWAVCPACKVSLDRDQAGSERIAGRGLSPSADYVIRAKISSPTPDPRTAPKRGPKAKVMRDSLAYNSATLEIPEAGTLVTPPQLASDGLSGHRPAAAETQDPQSGLQSGYTLDLGSSIPTSPISPPSPQAVWTGRAPRTLDGLRSAYLGLIKCSPVVEITSNP